MAVTSLLEVSLAWKTGGNNVEKGRQRQNCMMSIDKAFDKSEF